MKTVQARFPSIPRTHVAAYYAEWRAEQRGDGIEPDEVMLRCKICETLYTVPSGWHGAITLNICGKCSLYDYILDAVSDRILKTRPASTTISELPSLATTT